MRHLFLFIAAFCVFFTAKSYSQDIKMTEPEGEVKRVQLPPELSYLEAQQSLLAAYEKENLPIHEMSVSFYNGSMTLSGYVDFPNQIELAASMALKTPGVTQVYNYLVSKN